MKDSRLWKLKNQVTFDKRLSNTGHRLLCCLCSHLYNTPHADPEEFELPYHLAGKWIQLTHQRAIYGHIDELVKPGFLVKLGLKGCPARTLYRMPLAVLVQEGHAPPVNPTKPRKPCQAKSHR